MTAPVSDLDDPVALAAGDPGGMLPAIASSAAQVREALALCAEAGLADLERQDRPRTVVVCGMGGSGVAGDVLAAVLGEQAPVPVLTHRGYGLPAWVGATDLVVAVSCSGRTEETLAALEEARRRGCRLLVVAAAGSPAHEIGLRGRASYVPVPQGRQPRASMWALSTPLLLAAGHLGLAPAGGPLDEAVLVATADLLEDLAVRCAPTSGEIVNPAKRLARALHGTLPVAWGSSPLAGVAAYRFACQLNENAALPATWGVLPEVDHNQVVAFDGPFARRSEADLFADPYDLAEESPEGPPAISTRQHVVVLRDTVEHPRTRLRVDVTRHVAQDRGVAWTEVEAEGASAPERLASLVAVTDWASAYLALLGGVDPTPVAPIVELKDRLGG